MKSILVASQCSSRLCRNMITFHRQNDKLLQLHSACFVHYPICMTLTCLELGQSTSAAEYSSRLSWNHIMTREKEQGEERVPWRVDMCCLGHCIEQVRSLQSSSTRLFSMLLQEFCASPPQAHQSACYWTESLQLSSYRLAPPLHLLIQVWATCNVHISTVVKIEQLNYTRNLSDYWKHHQKAVATDVQRTLKNCFLKVERLEFSLQRSICHLIFQWTRELSSSSFHPSHSYRRCTCHNLKFPTLVGSKTP